MRPSLSFLAPVAAAAVAAQNATTPDLPTVTLDYCTIKAAAGNESALAGPYVRYQNVRYAAVPTGDLRWAEPQWPPVEDGINDGSYADPDVSCGSVEDCLYMDIWAPTNVTGRSLPVLVWSYGAGSDKTTATPEGLFDISNDFIMVAYNYRDGIFGVANGPTFAHEGGSTNAAIRDTEHAYKWVKKYISNFGGDPDNIVAGGFSAGSSQNVHMITRYAGRAEQLFARAYLTSPGFTPSAGHDQAELYWQNVSTAVGCDGGHMNCMRSVDFTNLSSIAGEMIGTSQYTIQPRADGDIVADTWESQLYMGRHNFTGPLVITHELHEANSSPYSGVNSTDDIKATLRLIFPSITDERIEEVLSIFPEEDYTSAGLRYSDIKQSYDLTGHNLAVTRALNNQTWNAMVALGEATHGTDQNYYWYSTYTLSDATSSSNTSALSKRASSSSSVNATTAHIMQKYFLSFILTGNTNTMWSDEKMHWPLYNTSSDGVELVFNTTMYTQADSLANKKSLWWVQALWY